MASASEYRRSEDGLIGARGEQVADAAVEVVVVGPEVVARLRKFGSGTVLLAPDEVVTLRVWVPSLTYRPIRAFMQDGRVDVVERTPRQTGFVGSTGFWLVLVLSFMGAWVFSYLTGFSSGVRVAQESDSVSTNQNEDESPTPE